MTGFDGSVAMVKRTAGLRSRSPLTLEHKYYAYSVSLEKRGRHLWKARWYRGSNSRFEQAQRKLKAAEDAAEYSAGQFALALGDQQADSSSWKRRCITAGGILSLRAAAGMRDENEKPAGSD